MRYRCLRTKHKQSLQRSALRQMIGMANRKGNGDVIGYLRIWNRQWSEDLKVYPGPLITLLRCSFQPWPP